MEGRSKTASTVWINRELLAEAGDTRDGECSLTKIIQTILRVHAHRVAADQERQNRGPAITDERLPHAC